MNPNQKQLCLCLLEVAKRAEELGEKEIAKSLTVMVTASMTGCQKEFAKWCHMYAEAKLMQALEDFGNMLAGKGGVTKADAKTPLVSEEKKPLDTNANPDKV